jgi:D-alanyl-D-alanine carboxypeptidase
MKKILITTLIALLFMPNIVFATSRNVAEFNPNFIITDEELGYWQSMDLGAIDRFLRSKGGFISTLVIEDTDGIRRPVAEIIYNTAKKYQINPKYLIVKLQKEQSLVTAKNPTQKQLDWATGYAVCDSCAMDDPRIQKFRGFGHQVDYAAGIMRWYYDNVATQGFIRRAGVTYTISGQEVTPTTLATAFLYTYTPHILGNRNFWLLWNTWFESRFPNGTLITGQNSPEVYLLEDNKKRLFVNYTALITRFDPKFIVTVPDAELADYANGPDIRLPNYAVLQEGSNYYLLDFDTLRPFASQAVVRDLGYNPEEIIEVTETDIRGYRLGQTIHSSNANPLGELAFVKELNTHFYIKDGIYNVIVDNRIIPINYSHLTPVQRTVAYMETLVAGPPATIKNGVIFGIEGFNEIYVMENGEKRHISNPKVFEGMGYKWENIQWVTPITGTAIRTGAPLDSAPNREASTNGAATFDRSNVDIVAGTISSSAISTPSPTRPQAPTSPATTVKQPIDHFIRTPAENTTYVGTSQFNTEIDAYLVYDVTKGDIVSGKNIDVIRQPASLQKVVTSYLLDQKNVNLNAGTTYKESKHRSIYHRYRVVENERIRNANLFDAFLVSSLNTPGRMLVDSTTGNEAQFIKDMNALVKEWGLTKTTMVDVTGERNQNKTTAREYLTIFKKGIENELTNSYLSKRNYQYTALVDFDGKPNHSDSHTNELLRRTNLPYTILASKTGFLWESGANLVMHVRRNTDNKEFIIVTLGNPNFDNRFLAPDELTRWAITNF